MARIDFSQGAAKSQKGGLLAFFCRYTTPKPEPPGPMATPTIVWYHQPKPQHTRKRLMVAEAHVSVPEA